MTSVPLVTEIFLESWHVWSEKEQPADFPFESSFWWPLKMTTDCCTSPQPKWQSLDKYYEIALLILFQPKVGAGRHLSSSNQKKATLLLEHVCLTWPQQIKGHYSRLSRFCRLSEKFSAPSHLSNRSRVCVCVVRWKYIDSGLDSVGARGGWSVSFELIKNSMKY